MDRRRQHVKAFFYQFVNPRRKNRKRRATDSQIYFVDFHEPRLIMVVVPILLLCIIDTYATLILVNHGGGEFNPFMELLINANVWLFYVIKYLLTATAVLVLLSYRRFLFFGLTGLHTLYGTLVVYITLIGYHAVGLLSVPPG